MNQDQFRQWRKLVAEENKHNATAKAALRAVQPRKGRVVDRKLLEIAEREIVQAQFARAVQGSRVYQSSREDQPK